LRTGYTVFKDGTTELDYEKTAKKTYEMYLTPRPGQDPASPNLRVKNFLPRLVVKDTWEWNQCIKKVGEV
jgi:hypothetical protein